MPKKRNQNEAATTTFTAAGSGLNTPVVGKLSSKIGKSKAELGRERKPEKRILGLDDAPRHTKGRWTEGEMEAAASSLAVSPLPAFTTQQAARITFGLIILIG